MTDTMIGIKLPQTCSKCGADVMNYTSWCGICGYKPGTADAPVEPTPSAEAQALADRIYKWPGYAFIDGRVAEEIDAFAAQARIAAIADIEREIIDEAKHWPANYGSQSAFVSVLTRIRALVRPIGETEG